MSFDLHFKISDNQNLETVQKYFAKRKNYQMNNGQAWYENEDTGVYFSFEWPRPEEKHQDPSVVTFNLNLARPRSFAMEAAEELGPFVSTFSALAKNPQLDDQYQEYSKARFEASWNDSNKFALDALAAGNDALSLPSELLRSIWSWNFTRDQLQERFDADYFFVPAIMLCRYDGRLATFVCWPHLQPILIPDVDFVYIQMRKMFFDVGSVLIKTESLPPGKSRITDMPLPAKVIASDDDQKDEVRRLFKHPPKLRGPFEGISFDRVIDRDC
jgi:hypothetical protein